MSKENYFRIIVVINVMGMGVDLKGFLNNVLFYLYCLMFVWIRFVINFFMNNFIINGVYVVIWRFFCC